MKQQTLTLPKTYRIKTRDLMRLLVTGLVILIFVAAAFWLHVYTIVLLGLFAPPLFCVVIGARMTLSDAGMTLNGRLFTPWSNIIGVRMSRVGVEKWRISRVILAEPAKKGSTIATSILRIFPLIRKNKAFEWLMSSFSADVTSLPMVDIWYKDEIEDYLRQYAPQAFEDVSLDVDDFLTPYTITYSKLRQAVQPMTLSSDPLPLPKVYWSSIWPALGTLLFGIGMAAVAFSMIILLHSAIMPHDILSILFVLMMVVCGLVMLFLCGIGGFFQQKNCRLELSAEGLTHYDCYYRMFTPWQNVVGFGSVMGKRNARGLMLREAAIRGMSLADGIQQGVAVLESKGWSPFNLDMVKRFFIIKYAFCGRDWEYGELGMYLRQYAPHLFAETSEIMEHAQK